MGSCVPVVLSAKAALPEPLSSQLTSFTSEFQSILCRALQQMVLSRERLNPTPSLGENRLRVGRGTGLFGLGVRGAAGSPWAEQGRDRSGRHSAWLSPHRPVVAGSSTGCHHQSVQRDGAPGAPVCPPQCGGQSRVRQDPWEFRFGPHFSRERGDPRTGICCPCPC